MRYLSPDGQLRPYRYPAITRSNGQNTTVAQDVWNPIPQWPQTLHAIELGNWYVTADMPAGNTAVVSFPDVGQQYYYPNTLADFSSNHSSFAEDMNQVSGTSAEAAYDIWLNDWRNEVMIQNDIVNRGACPVLTSARFGGSGGVPVQLWSLCRYGSELIWQLFRSRRTVWPGEHPRHALPAGRPLVPAEGVGADRYQLRFRDLLHRRPAGDVHGQRVFDQRRR